MSNKLASSTPPAPVAVLNFPFASHPSSLLKFIRTISAVSPDVKFTFFSTLKINSSLFSGSNTKGLDNIKPYNIPDGLPEGYVPRPGPPLEQIGFFLKKAPQTFEMALKEVEAETGHKFGCLISDAFLWFSGDIAEKLRVPWVTTWSGPRPLLVHLETDLIREKVGAPGKFIYCVLPCVLCIDHFVYRSINFHAFITLLCTYFCRTRRQAPGLPSRILK